jgi:hypothetical protein
LSWGQPDPCGDGKGGERSPTKSEPASTARRCGPGERDGKEYARNRRLRPRFEPVDMGQERCIPTRFGSGTLGLVSATGRETTVNRYGGAVVRPDALCLTESADLQFICSLLRDSAVGGETICCPRALQLAFEPASTPDAVTPR